jgi:hypothetical protein
MIEGKIDFDASISIESNGKVNLHLYMGERSCEPVVEGGVHLNVLIDDILDSFISPQTKKIADYHMEEAQQLVAELKSAVKYAKRRIKELS